MSLGCKLENLRVSYLLYLLDASASSPSHSTVYSPHTHRAAPSRDNPERSARRGASGSLDGVHGRLVCCVGREMRRMRRKEARWYAHIRRRAL